MINQQKLAEIGQKTEKILADRGADGKMGLYISSKAWSEGKIELKVMTMIPYELTPQEAREFGWALFMLGKYGTELVEDTDHEIDDEEFFKD